MHSERIFHRDKYTGFGKEKWMLSGGAIRQDGVAAAPATPGRPRSGRDGAPLGHRRLGRVQLGEAGHRAQVVGHDGVVAVADGAARQRGIQAGQLGRRLRLGQDGRRPRGSPRGRPRGRRAAAAAATAIGAAQGKALSRRVVLDQGELPPGPCRAPLPAAGPCRRPLALAILGVGGVGALLAPRVAEGSRQPLAPLVVAVPRPPLPAPLLLLELRPPALSLTRRLGRGVGAGRGRAAGRLQVVVVRRGSGRAPPPPHAARAPLLRVVLQLDCNELGHIGTNDRPTWS